MERSKQNKHLVCDGDDDVEDDVDNGDNNSVDEGDDDDDVEEGAEGADKHIAHLSQAADCCMTERSKQNKHLVCDVDDHVDNGDNNSVDDGDDDGVEDGAEGADKHLAHLSQAADCCMTERSKQKEHLFCDE
eukprot:13546441-Ditylum_brightwellii.AAC.1